MNKIYLLLLIFFFSITSVIAIERDTFIEESLQGKVLSKPQTNINYNYESLAKIPIKLNITETISTKKDDIYDGQIVKFKVKENVFLNNQLFIKQGTIATARVETTVDRGMNGLPATIILDNFQINNIPQEKLKCTIIHKGLNLALLVFPIKWILTPIPGAGTCTNLILGGHANIKQKKTLTIYYYPHWAEKV
ncbi:MAG: hypothetical protein IJY61_09115 [Candidatus Gastranaerophilales bacterium]|nr:hypothetical protein [Candidatus Gastranaerophilales bacterium]